MNFHCDLFEVDADTSGVWIHADDCNAGAEMRSVSIFVKACGGDGVTIYVCNETKDLLQEIFLDWDELEALKK